MSPNRDLVVEEESLSKIEEVFDQNQMMQYLNSKELQAGFQRVVLDMLLAKRA